MLESAHPNMGVFSSSACAVSKAPEMKTHHLGCIFMLGVCEGVEYAPVMGASSCLACAEGHGTRKHPTRVAKHKKAPPVGGLCSASMTFCI